MFLATVLLRCYFQFTFLLSIYIYLGSAIFAALVESVPELQICLV